MKNYSFSNLYFLLLTKAFGKIFTFTLKLWPEFLCAYFFHNPYLTVPVSLISAIIFNNPKGYEVELKVTVLRLLNFK